MKWCSCAIRSLGLGEGVVEGTTGVASKYLKNGGAFKFAGMPNMKLEGHEISDVGVREGALDHEMKMTFEGREISDVEVREGALGREMNMKFEVHERIDVGVREGALGHEEQMEGP